VKKLFSWSEIEEGDENGKVLLDRWRKEGSVRDAKFLNFGWTDGKMEAPLGCFWL
jgi:hypothetical protein